MYSVIERKIATLPLKKIMAARQSQAVLYRRRGLEFEVYCTEYLAREKGRGDTSIHVRVSFPIEKVLDQLQIRFDRTVLHPANGFPAPPSVSFS